MRLLVDTVIHTCFFVVFVVVFFFTFVGWRQRVALNDDLFNMVQQYLEFARVELPPAQVAALQASLRTSVEHYGGALQYAEAQVANNNRDLVLDMEIALPLTVVAAFAAATGLAWARSMPILHIYAHAAGVIGIVAVSEALIMWGFATAFISLDPSWLIGVLALTSQGWIAQSQCLTLESMLHSMFPAFFPAVVGDSLQ